MNASMLLWNRLKKNRLIALTAPENAADCLAAYETLYDLGVVLEVALRSPAALNSIRDIVGKHPDALILAGTVMTPEQAVQAIEAGATGIVSPDYVPAVVEVCAERDVMCIPGGLGDVGKQLAHKAALYKCELDELRTHFPYQWMYKLFPAMAAVPTFLELARAWSAIFKDLVIVYTGGVKAENISEIVRRDSKGIICGSALIPEGADRTRLKEEAERWLSVIHDDQPEEIQRTAVSIETPEEDRPMPAQEKPKEKKVAAPKPAENVEKPEKAEKVEKAAEAQGPVDKDVVVTFGEILLRLSPPMGLRLGQTTSFDSTFGGAEANVAVALANYGLKSRYVTALPDHAIGQAAVNSLRAYGVDTRYILRQGDRVGIYYHEHGASQRPSRLIYDRKGSSLSEIVPDQMDWESVFRGARWFHWAGITPGLSDSAAEATMEALKAAKRAGAIVSVDISYQSELWDKERVQEIMVPMMLYVDVAIGTADDVSMVFDIKPPKSDPAKGEPKIEEFEDVAKEMVSSVGFKMAAITQGEGHSASDSVWSACLFDGEHFHHSKKYPIHTVDRIGGGDAFTAGLIHSFIARKNPKDALEFAVAASCLKQTIQGDFNVVSAQEVEILAAGNSTGCLVR